MVVVLQVMAYEMLFGKGKIQGECTVQGSSGLCVIVELNWLL